MESIHGHEVMHMIADAGRVFSKAELVTEIDGKFGEGARFHTCSAENMSAGELVEFLISRGKFQSSDEQALTLDESAICQH
jgi:probable metal-binding protein